MIYINYLFLYEISLLLTTVWNFYLIWIINKYILLKINK